MKFGLQPAGQPARAEPWCADATDALRHQCRTRFVLSAKPGAGGRPYTPLPENSDVRHRRHGPRPPCARWPGPRMTDSFLAGDDGTDHDIIAEANLDLLPPADCRLPQRTVARNESPMGDSPGDPALPPPVPLSPPPARGPGSDDTFRNNAATPPLTVGTVVKMSVAHMLDDQGKIKELLTHVRGLCTTGLGDEVTWQGAKVSVLRASHSGASSPQVVRMVTNGPQPTQPWARDSIAVVVEDSAQPDLIAASREFQSWSVESAVEDTAAKKLTWRSQGSWVRAKVDGLQVLYHKPSGNYKSRVAGAAPSTSTASLGGGGAAAAAAAAEAPKIYLLCVHKPRSQHSSSGGARGGGDDGSPMSGYSSPEEYRTRHCLSSFQMGSSPAAPKRRSKVTYEQAWKRHKAGDATALGSFLSSLSAQARTALSQRLQDPATMRVGGALPTATAQPVLVEDEEEDDTCIAAALECDDWPASDQWQSDDSVDADGNTAGEPLMRAPTTMAEADETDDEEDWSTLPPTLVCDPEARRDTLDALLEVESRIHALSVLVLQDSSFACDDECEMIHDVATAIDGFAHITTSSEEHLRQALQAEFRLPFNVLHYAGHGHPQPGEGDPDAAACLASAPGRAPQAIAGVTACVEAYLNEHPRSLESVILNACHTEAQGRMLSRVGVPVVCYSGEVAHELAEAFAAGFYEALSHGKALLGAYKWGTAQVKQDVSSTVREKSAYPLLLLPRDPESICQPMDPDANMPAYDDRRAFESYQTFLGKTAETRCRRHVDLRSYQAELVQEIMGGGQAHNAIVVLPTGAGKTLVSTRVVEKCVRRHPTKFAIFMVHTIPLVFQQARVFDEFTDLCVGTYCGEMSMFNWEEELSTKQVIVITAGLLQVLLAKRQLSLSDCSILVCDEVHHATKNHPFNQVLKDYFFTCEAESQPQFLGLTASPGGEATEEETHQKIVKLCLNTKAKVITPRKHRAELEKHVMMKAEVQFELIPEDRDEGNRFDEILQHFVRGLAQVLQSCEGFSSKLAKKLMQFQVATSTCQSEFELMDLPQAERYCAHNEAWAFVVGCIRDCYDAYFQRREESYAAAYLAVEATLHKIGNRWPNLPPSDTSVSEGLRRLLQDRQLQQIMAGETKPLKEFRSSKAAHLIEYLQDKIQTNDARVLVFVTQRSTAQSLCSLIKKSDKVGDYWKPGVLTGHGTADDGMGWKEQVAMVDSFNQGEVNLLIATSVAEEGMDIQACNYVIRLDTTSTVEAMIQSRGRARHHDSNFVVFLRTDREESDIEALQAKERMMLRTVERLMTGALPTQLPYTDVSAQTTGELNLERLEQAGQRPFTEQDAVGLLQKFCEKTADQILYDYSTRGSSLVRKHVVIVKLPMGCKLPLQQTGEERSTREAAQAAAAYQVCVVLHAYGLLDNYVGSNFALDASEQRRSNRTAALHKKSPIKESAASNPIQKVNELCSKNKWSASAWGEEQLEDLSFRCSVTVSDCNELPSMRARTFYGEPASTKKRAKANAAESWLQQAYPASPEPEPEPETQPRLEPEPMQSSAAEDDVVTATAVGESGTPSPSATTIAEWLSGAKLPDFIGALATIGYEDDLDLLKDADAEELEDIVRAVENLSEVMKPKRKKFKRELAKLRGKGEEFT